MSSPVSALLESDQTPLSDLLSLIPAGPTTQRGANHVEASHYVTFHYYIVSDLPININKYDLYTSIFVLK